ncbi:MAG: cardiolipin synthase [Treponema sp.]|jgi:cardiolipin synthase|nr:cardiolipin synthase [Treponema sp.]
MYIPLLILSGLWALLNLVLVLFLLFFERGAVYHRITWILILIFLPVAGTVLFVMFGGRFFTKPPKLQKIMNLIAGDLKQMTDAQDSFLQSRQASLPYPLLREYYHFIQMNLHRNNSFLVTSDSAAIQISGAEHFAALEADLEGAQASIHMQYFIFHNDKTGGKIMEILCRKAASGLEVKLIFDDFGSIRTPHSFFNRLVKAGGEVLPFFPVRWRMPFFINFRNHRKIAVIDGQIGYLGGNNIGDEYANQAAKPRFYWRDTQLRLTGASVAVLRTLFLVDWYGIAEWKNRLPPSAKKRTVSNYPTQLTAAGRTLLNAGKRSFGQLQNGGAIPTQIIYSAPDDVNRDKIKNAFVKMISAAKKYVYIQTPYFMPDEVFATALKIAAYSGVDVRVMIPGTWDKSYVKAASSGFVRDMLREGVRFFHYPGFIHAKSITVDDGISSIGTVNIDSRSFHLHFEVSALLYDKSIAQQNRTIFLSDQKECAEARQDWYDSRNPFVKAWWGFCKLFSPFM